MMRAHSSLLRALSPEPAVGLVGGVEDHQVAVFLLHFAPGIPQVIGGLQGKADHALVGLLEAAHFPQDVRVPLQGGLSLPTGVMPG